MSKKETVKAAQVKAAKAAQKTVYIGPTITGLAARNTVYDELPEAMNKVTAALPYMAGLCIPFSQLGNALTNIQRQSGHSYRLFCKAQADMRQIEAILQESEVE